LRQECQYRRRRQNMRVSCYPSSPRGQGTTSSFYRAREGGLQSRRVALSAACGSMAYSAVELTSVLVNLASGRRRGESYARPGATSRGVASEFLFDRRPYASSRGWLMEDRRPHSGGRGDVLSTWVPTRFPQCWGWPCSAWDGDTVVGMAAQGRR
jgi:hypothetical protein